MIDLFSIALSHGLILMALWRILFRPELDDEEAAEDKPVKPWQRNRDGGVAGTGAEARNDA